MLPDTILRIANEEEFKWLLQPELKAIKEGLIYVEDKDFVYYVHRGKYKGYLNAQGQREGVGIVIENYHKTIGEWHKDNLHGTAKIEWKDGGIWWGQYKHSKTVGYWAQQFKDGRVNYCHFKNYSNGYGI